MLPEHVNVMALTATATVATRSLVCQSLGMTKEWLWQAVSDEGVVVVAGSEAVSDQGVVVAAGSEAACV